MNSNKNFSLDMKIAYICKNQYNYFLSKKNITGIALGYKITKGFCTFKKCITVFVEKKLSLNELSKENIIPKFFTGIETDVVQSGIFTNQSLTSRVRPNINGYSIGHRLSLGSGTSGCLVQDNLLYILGCNHVLALNNSAPLESDIFQPSVSDGGSERKNVIGHLHRFVPIQYKKRGSTPENLVDCALCRVESRFVASPEIAFIGIPKGIGKAKLNLDVQKVGRSTELTKGKITNLYGTFITKNPLQQEALFKNQIVTTSMSSKGDSGSLLVTKDNYALGLLMSGNDNTSDYNPIEDVLKSLKVELVIS